MHAYMLINMLGNKYCCIFEYLLILFTEPSRIIGKSFESFALDVQIIKDGQIKRTWHFEDWTSALAQMLGAPKPLLRNPRETPGEILLDVPESLKNFYDKIISDPLGQGQNETLVNSVFNPDWQVRINNLNPLTRGPGKSC